jgi:hypothetical protein
MERERRDFIGGLAAALATGLLGCRSEESEPPAGPRQPGRERDAGTDASMGDEQEASMKALRLSRVDLVSTGGHAMARVGELELREWSSWLRIRGDLQRAELALTRHAGDLVERPVGRFGQAIDAATLLRLQDAIAAIDWDALPEPLIADPTANMLMLELVLGERVIRREFSASAQAFMTAIWPVLEQLHAIMGMQLTAPIAALQVEVGVQEAVDARQWSQWATLRLRNVGSEALVIADPRAPLDSLGPRARFMIAAKPANDMQMPSWSPIDLPFNRYVPEQHELTPGGELVIDQVFVQTAGPGSYLLQAIWQDYAGPREPPSDLLGFMPLPATGEPPRGRYGVRGAAFSSYLAFDV